MNSIPSPSSDSVAAEMRRIHQLIAGGHLQEAATALNAAQRAAPNDARVAMLGVVLAQRAGNLNGAVAAARRALTLAPRWAPAMIELGLALARRGDLAEALQWAHNALALAPQNPEALDRALGIAEQAGAAREVTAWASAGARLRPGQVSYPLALARLGMAQKDFARAREHFQAVVAIDPEHLQALQGVLECSLNLGDTQAAQEQAQALIARFPQDARTGYLHALAHGQTPPTQPAPMVTALFDSFAAGYDMHMVRGLKYQAPRQVAQMLLALYPDRRFNLLDLGCGTGLLGVYLGPIDGVVIGVDLSQPMLAQAARHGVYARLHHANLLDALRETPADLYEVITCLDALTYVGDPAPVIAGALRVLKPGGHFIFTCESAAEDEADLVLRPVSLCYAHKASVVERACRAAGFCEVRIEHLPALRMEGGKPLPGFLVTARKPV